MRSLHSYSLLQLNELSLSLSERTLSFRTLFRLRCVIIHENKTLCEDSFIHDMDMNKSMGGERERWVWSEEHEVEQLANELTFDFKKCASSSSFSSSSSSSVSFSFPSSPLGFVLAGKVQMHLFTAPRRELFVIVVAAGDRHYCFKLTSRMGFIFEQSFLYTHVHGQDQISHLTQLQTVERRERERE